MLKSILASVALLLAAGSQAFIIPALEDGIYKISFDTNGEILNAPVLIQALDNTINVHQLQRRAPPLPNPKTTCGSGQNLDVSGLTVAANAMKTLCDNQKPQEANTAVVYTFQNAVAYWCNYNAKNWCHRTEFDEALGLIDRTCGSGRAGVVKIDQYSKSYGREVVGASICT